MRSKVKLKKTMPKDRKRFMAIAALSLRNGASYCRFAKMTAKPKLAEDLSLMSAILVRWAAYLDKQAGAK